MKATEIKENEDSAGRAHRAGMAREKKREKSPSAVYEGKSGVK